MNVDELAARALNPTDEDRRITRAAEKLKQEHPELWREIAREVFGLRTLPGAEALLPQAITLRVATHRRRNGQAWCIDAEGRYLIAEA